MATRVGGDVSIKVSIQSPSGKGIEGSRGGESPAITRGKTATTETTRLEKIGKEALKKWDQEVKSALKRRASFQEGLFPKSGKAASMGVLGTLGALWSQFQALKTAGAIYETAKISPYITAALQGLLPGLMEKSFGQSVDSFALMVKDRIDFLENRIKAIGGSIDESVTTTRAMSRLGLEGGALYDDFFRQVQEKEAQLTSKFEAERTRGTIRNLADQARSSLHK